MQRKVGLGMWHKFRKGKDGFSARLLSCAVEVECVKIKVVFLSGYPGWILK